MQLQSQTHCNAVFRSMTVSPPVIAQQYFSAIYVSMAFGYTKFKFGAHLKSYDFNLLFFLNWVIMKLRNLEMHTAGSV